MTAAAKRISTYTSASTQSDARNGEQKKDLWTSMLDSVASGKRLPEKNILVLGGSPETQREFLDSLSNGDQRRTIDRQRTPPIANNFALGYTYHDVLDADQEDTLARISLYLLSTPSPSFTTLLKPLLTPDTIPNTLVVVLLDWSQPTAWLRELQAWILMLRDILRSLDAECMDAMEDVMISWRDRGRGGASLNLDGTGHVAAAAAAAAGAGAGDGSDAALPVGPGEWEDALGLPLCVVCQNADKMEVLEKSQGWKEADFDQILQYLRTVLLRHGASLIYTTPHIPSQLQSLIHASLGITSLIKRQPLKHNVIDRDKILVPPNWDSWGKIRVLREGFDVEGVSAGWSQDIEREWPFPSSPDPPNPRALGDGEDQDEEQDDEDDVMRGCRGPSARGHYEAWVPDASLAGLHLAGQQQESGAGALEVVSEDAQGFLADQARMLDVYKEQDAQESKEKEKDADHRHGAGGKLGRGGRLEEMGGAGGSMVTDHIGPVQFNMGGIQVDADDMLQRLKDRQEYTATEPTTPPGDAGPQPPAGAGLEAFFANLMNRKAGTSVPGSPSRGS